MQVDIKINYIVFASITLFISFLGKIFSESGMQWYYALSRPSYTPPGWLFSIVWMVIYVLVTIAVIQIWNSFERDKEFYMIMALFVANALSNLLWTYLFFYRQNICLAFADSLVIFASVLSLIITIGNKSYMIAALLVPYLSWITFAVWLNLMIWFKN
jgi:tryptophan-rich sensory protein